MSRDMKDIANEAYDDIVSQGCGHKTARTIFRAISKLLPEGELAGDLARIGAAHSEEWESLAEGWAARMSQELSAAEESAQQNATPLNRVADVGAPK